MRIDVRRWLTALVVLAPLGAAGCVQLPDSGPVVPAGTHGATDVRPPSDIDPERPVAGESQLDVVNGFLQSMTAWPLTTTVAKEYLTTDAAQAWNPVRATVVYANFDPPTEEAGGVAVRLSGAARLDSAGGWRGGLPADQQVLRFHVVREHGQYRIADPPDEMVVPSTWFQQRFGEVSLYYFDPAAHYLVPEPVFVPLGDQLPTALVAALLAGPPRGLAGVVRSYLPGGLSLGLSVPVTAGVAQVDLVGGRTQPSAQEADLMLSQIAATLSQDADLTGFRVTLNGHPIATGNPDRLYPVGIDEGLAATARAPFALYGVFRQRLVGGEVGKMTPVPGPLGSGTRPLDSVAVAPNGEHAVAVVDGGTAAIDAPTTAGTRPVVHTLLAGATSLAQPTIDAAGRVWLLDRTRGGAVVRSWQDGRLTELTVPGVTGEDARRLLVSRDGTRLVAVVHHAGGDRVVGARVATEPDGRIRRLVAPFHIPVGGGRRVDDIVWATSSRLAVLSPTRTGSLYQVDIVAVDGSPFAADSTSTVIGGHVTGLAGSPDGGLPTYAIMGRALVDVRTRIATTLGSPVTDLTYPG